MISKYISDTLRTILKNTPKKKYVNIEELDLKYDILNCNTKNKVRTTCTVEKLHMLRTNLYLVFKAKRNFCIYIIYNTKVKKINIYDIYKEQHKAISLRFRS